MHIPYQMLKATTTTTFIETSVNNLSFDLAKYKNWTKTMCFLSPYIEIPTNLTKVIFFGVG